MNEEFYKLAVQVVNATLTNILIECGDGDIYLENFNRKDMSHVYFLEVAKIAATIKHKTVYIDGPYWEVIKLKFSNHRGNRYIKHFNSKNVDKKTIDVPFFLNFMSEAFNISKNSYINIYNLYYKGGKNGSKSMD